MGWRIKVSERTVFWVNVLITIEQMTILMGTVWLVGWQSWNPWWFVGAFFLMCASSPSVIFPIMQRYIK